MERISGISFYLFCTTFVNILMHQWWVVICFGLIFCDLKFLEKFQRSLKKQNSDRLPRFNEQMDELPVLSQDELDILSFLLPQAETISDEDRVDSKKKRRREIAQKSESKRRQLMKQKFEELRQILPANQVG
jgi:hypothetical protein